jgi:putative FmdB family regulatory protein
MPIFDYQCKKCGHSFDVLQKLSDPVLKKCPECGALKLQRLVSAPQFRLKGTGWYETDFKRDGKKRLADSADSDSKPVADGDKGEKADKADKPGKADKADAKKDKKPAAGTASAAD